MGSTHTSARVTRLLAVVLLAGGVAATLAHVVTAQAPARDTPAASQAVPSGMVRGRIVRADDGQALSGVRVWLRASGFRDLPAAVTAGDGRFELPGVPAGSFILTAAKIGFVTTQYGQSRFRQEGVPIELGPGELIEAIDLALPRGGVITGMVVDEAGDPVVSAIVQVSRAQYARGRRRLVSDADVNVDVTDDRGAFRIHGIPPGRYVISSSVGRPQRSDSSPEPAFVTRTVSIGALTSFYPGTASAAEAQVFEIGAGQEVSGLVFTSVAPKLATISGVVRHAGGPLPDRVTLSLVQSLPFTVGGMSSSGAPIRADGTFALQGLPPGPYSLRAVTSPRDGTMASAFVRLDGTDIVVPLVLQKAAAARGRLTFGTSSPPQSVLPTAIQFIPEDPDDPSGSLSARFQGDWSFEVPEVTGRRRLRVQPPPGWTLESAQMRGADVTDAVFDFDAGDVSGLEVRLTDRLTEASIAVKDQSGRDIADAAVIVFAEDRAKWGPESRFVAAARPNRSGRFLVSGLPPGRYRAVARSSYEPGEETDPAVLEKLYPSATPVMLDAGQQTAVELTISASR